MLLAIDTSAGTSVAIVDDSGAVIAERTSGDRRGHAESIGTLIQECLALASRPAVSQVAVGMGPGPYTGLRVGIAAARAFAFGSGAVVVPIASHDAIAFELARAATIATDARRRELAVSVYAEPDASGLPVPRSGPQLVRRVDLPPDAEEIAVVSAGALGMLALRLQSHARPLGPTAPLYLRAPDVTIPAGPKRVGR